MTNDYKFLEQTPRVFGLAMLASAFTAHERDGRVSSVELARGHDYHAFYRLGNGNEDKVVHVQFYTGMSELNGARVFARLMNYDKIIEVREKGGTSKGNEHQAVIKPFPNFGCGVLVENYDTRQLEKMIEEKRGGIKMKNPVSIIYDFFGKSIMDSANYAVKTYNWTTGGTKRDLANNLLNLSVITECSGSFIDGSPISIAFLPISLSTAYIYKKMNNEQHKLEEEAKKFNALNLEVEIHRKTKNKIGAGVWTAGAAIDLDLYAKSNHIKGMWLGAAAASSLRVGSFLVMNANDLPPRKNCVSRGLEKMTEYIEAASMQPSLVPVSTRNYSVGELR